MQVGGGSLGQQQQDNNVLSAQPEIANLHDFNNNPQERDDALKDVDFESGMEDNYNPNNFGQENVNLGQGPMLNREPSQSEDDLNGNTETVYDNNLNDANLDDEGEGMQNQEGEEGGEEEEGESVYMIDGVVMKVI